MRLVIALLALVWAVPAGAATYRIDVTGSVSSNFTIYNNFPFGGPALDLAPTDPALAGTYLEDLAAATSGSVTIETATLGPNAHTSFKGSGLLSPLFGRTNFPVGDAGPENGFFVSDSSGGIQAKVTLSGYDYWTDGGVVIGETLYLFIQYSVTFTSYKVTELPTSQEPQPVPLPAPGILMIALLAMPLCRRCLQALHSRPGPHPVPA